MHQEVKRFIRKVRRLYPSNFFLKNVLEIGSLNINGSARDHFWLCAYVGIDLQAGRGVDVICPAKDYKMPGMFDTVVCCEMLEHDKDWKWSLLQAWDNLKPGGLFIFTCAGPDRPERGTSATTPGDSPFIKDYYRNISMEDFESVLPPDMFRLAYIAYERGQQDLQFFGFKIDQPATMPQSYFA